MALVTMIFWIVVLGVSLAGFFIGIGAGLAKFVMWLKGE